MMLLKLAVMAMAILLSSTSAFAAPIVLSNPYDVNSTDAYNSSRIDGLLDYVCYSDFYYDGSYEMTDFHWTGFFASNSFSGLSGFAFSIYTPDNSNPSLPGNPIYSQSVTGNANAISNGDLFSGFDVYDFSLDLTSPWTAPTGNYFLSVVGEFTLVRRGAFFWGVSQNQYGADDLQWINDGGIGFTTLSSEGDLAWEVTGNRLNVVPEPATMTLFGLGLLGSALAARRSKNRKQC